MNIREQTILDLLKQGEQSIWSLASRLDCPEASIRRTVGKLKRDGWHISDSRPGDGSYRLSEGNR